MTTFAVPSMLWAVGLVPEPRASDIDAALDPTFGDGQGVTDLVQALDSIIYALTFAGYRVIAIGCRPGTLSGGDWIYVADVDDMRFAVLDTDWSTSVGMDVSGDDTFVVSLDLVERTRYVGAGPTFAVDVPTLGGSAAFSELSGGWSLGFQRLGGSRPTSVQIELIGAGAFTRDDATLALIGASKVAAAVVFSDLVAATHSWWAIGSGESQPGLLPIRVDRRWRYARGSDGVGHLWLQLEKVPGRGERASGVRWDVIEITGTVP